MKHITIYSTCQGEGIRHYLQRYFPNDIISVIRNYQLVLYRYEHEINNFRQLLQTTNIFIYQEMPVKWGIYSTDLSVENNILSYLPNDCIKISISYVFADWYWAIGKSLFRDLTANFDKIDNETETFIKYYNKEVILDMKYKDHFSIDTILQLYDDNKINFNHKERMDRGINILKIKEKSCDIKISDFILKNYTKHHLFIIPNHPTHIILKEMAKQILERLNIDHSNFDTLTENDNYYLGGDAVFSKYDKQYFNFEFDINCDDHAVKNIITEIYNSY